MEDPTQTPLAPIPSYIEELRELAKLRDEGIITPQDFDMKKAQLLGLSTAQVPEPLTPTSTPKTLIEKHCAAVLAAAAVSPSSTRIRSCVVFPTPELPEAFRDAIQDGQRLEAPGTTVSIEYDSANSYGAMLPGKISCDYTEPYASPTELQVSLRMVMLNEEIVNKIQARLLGLKATWEVYGEIVAYQKQLSGTTE